MKQLIAALLLVPGLLAQSVISPVVPDKTSNGTVREIDEQIYRVAQEMTMMVSSRMTAITEDDKEKIDAYFVWLNRKLKTATTSITDFHFLAEMPLLNMTNITVGIENPAIQSAVQHLLLADVNLRTSQSNRLNDGLMPADKDDLSAAYAKAETYIVDFMGSDNPLDMSHSSPHEPVVVPMQLP